MYYGANETRCKHSKQCIFASGVHLINEQKRVNENTSSCEQTTRNPLNCLIYVTLTHVNALFTKREKS